MESGVNRLKRFALIGAGFWAPFQLAAWGEVSGAKCVAIVDREMEKAQALAKLHPSLTAYSDITKMLQNEWLDFLDVVTSVESHVPLVELAVLNKLDVITQKPMAPTLAEAERMILLCRDAGVRLLVHENWRWQAPIRELKRVLELGTIGRVFRASIDMISGFPVFENQPSLAKLKQFILTDLGTHTLDTARFLFGETSDIYCRTDRVHQSIEGEDVATMMLTMGGDSISVMIRLAYAGNFVERECFPQTLFFVEGTKGSLEIAPDYAIRITTADGTHSYRVPPPHFSWVDHRYAVVQASAVPCCENLLSGLVGRGAETTGEDNLKTLALVFSAYESAATGRVIHLS